MTLYDLLEIPDTADQDVIKAAYRRLAMKWHPDRNQDDAEAEARFKAIKEAYEVLSDPAARQQYDQTGTIPGNGPSREQQLHTDAVAVLTDAMASTFDPLTTDLIDLMQRKVRQHQRDMEGQRKQATAALEKLRRLAGKFSRADGKPNLLGEHILTQVANLEMQLAQLDTLIGGCDELVEYIGSYQFDRDGAASYTPMAVWGMSA